MLVAIVILGCTDEGDESGAADAGGGMDAGGGAEDAGADAGATRDADAGDRSDASGLVDAGRPTLDQASFVVELSKAYCASVALCCAGALDGCEQALAADLERTLESGEQAGNVFNEARARACVDAIAALDVNDVECTRGFASASGISAVCSEVLDGTVAPGEPCETVEDCRRSGADGTIEGGFVGCAELGGEAIKRCRKFSPTSEVGAECEMGFDGDAAEVFTCAGDLTCTGGACERLPSLDEPCPSGLCAPDLSCEAGTCKPYPGDGEACAGLCAAGLECNETTMKCAPAPDYAWILSVGFWSTTYTCGS